MYIMTIPAYAKRQFLLFLAIVIFTFIEFDDLTHFRKICMLTHLCMKLDSLINLYLIQEGANTVPIW